MFEDFLKRMTKGFGATMFLISLPVVMLMPSGCRAALRL